MSASDHLSENQFRIFHGTNKKIKGDFINPTKQRGSEWGGHGPEAAFASYHLEDAATYGKNVYEVHPVDRMEHHGSGVVSNEDGFKVKRQLKPEVVDRYSRIVGPIREAKEKREHGMWMHQSNSESWSHQGDKIYHVKYDPEGNEVRTQVARTGDRPK